MKPLPASFKLLDPVAALTESPLNVFFLVVREAIVWVKLYSFPTFSAINNLRPEMM
jgi:hypothetical protein